MIAVYLTAALLMPFHPHTTAELDAWYSDWLTLPPTADVMGAALVDMKERHPCFPETCKEVMPSEPDRNRNKSVGAVATPPPANSGMGSDVEQWRNLVAAYFPADQIDTALRIMACESGGNPDAYNPSGASGLMQVLASWADNFGLVPAQLFDPATNLQVSRYLWDDGGWSHWVCQ